MREIRTSGSEGGGIEANRCSLPLSVLPGISIGATASQFREKDRSNSDSFFDEFDLPGPGPFLQTFFTPDRKFDVAQLLIIHQSVHTICPAKSRNRVGAMFVDTANDIIGDTNVKRAANATRHDVDQ